MSRMGDGNEDGKIQICFHSYQLLHYFQKSRVGKWKGWMLFRKYRTITMKEQSRKVKRAWKASRKLRKNSTSIFISTVIYTYIYKMWKLFFKLLRTHYADLIIWNESYNTTTTIPCKGDRLYLKSSHPLTHLPKQILSKLVKKQALNPAYYWKWKPACVEIKPNSLSMYQSKPRMDVVCFSASGVF